MERTLSKSIKAKLRKLAGQAYERELGTELTGLETAFASWRAGKMNAFDLAEVIHEFHDGPARELYKSYVMGHSMNHLLVAAAIVRGVLTESDVGPEVAKTLEGDVAFFRRQQE